MFPLNALGGPLQVVVRGGRFRWRTVREVLVIVSIQCIGRDLAGLVGGETDHGDCSKGKYDMKVE